MYEVLTRCQVYEGVDIRCIHHGLQTGQLARPKMDKVDNVEMQLNNSDLKICQGLKRMMQTCWKITVAERPNAIKG